MQQITIWQLRFSLTQWEADGTRGPLADLKESHFMNIRLGRHGRDKEGGGDRLSRGHVQCCHFMMFYIIQ